MKLEDNVKLYGALSVVEMPKIYRTADIFLHMPIQWVRFERGGSYIHTETMGRGLCEALGSGLPIVTTNVGGVPEMVEDGSSGFVVPEKDYISASEKLNLLVSDSNLLKKIGENARARAKNLFDWPILFNQYKNLFNENG